MQNQAPPYTPKQFVKTQTTLHSMFLFAMLGFILVALVITDTWALEWNYEEDLFIFVIPIVAILGPLVSRFIYGKQMEIIKTLPHLKERLNRYQTARLISYVFIEFPALFAIVMFLKIENLFFLAIAVILVFYFFLQKPNKERIESDLNLNGDLKHQFNNSDQII